jgi:hypothetical protein
MLLGNGSPDYSKYRALNAARMLAVDKEPGVRPLACGEIWMRLIGRCVLDGESKQQAREACGNVQLCAGLQAGIEGNLHAVQKVWPESAGWTFDAEVEGVEGTEPNPFFSQDTDPGMAEDNADSRYAPETGHGTTLVDADNAFGRLVRYLALHQVYHRCNRISRYAFNKYRHHNIVYVRDEPGKPVIKILSKEGIAQGDPASMLIFGVATMPLCERAMVAVPETLHTWYADDDANTGEAKHNAAVLAFLMEHGPKYGYFPSAEKSWHICKGEDEEVAKAAFDEYGLDIQFTRGHVYLGGFIGSGETKRAWIDEKVEVWASAVGMLARRRRPRNIPRRRMLPLHSVCRANGNTCRELSRMWRHISLPLSEPFGMSFSQPYSISGVRISTPNSEKSCRTASRREASEFVIRLIRHHTLSTPQRRRRLS